MDVVSHICSCVTPSTGQGKHIRDLQCALEETIESESYLKKVVSFVMGILFLSEWLDGMLLSLHSSHVIASFWCCVVICAWRAPFQLLSEAMRKEVRAGAVTTELTTLLQEQKDKVAEVERASNHEMESLRKKLSTREEENALLEQRILVWNLSFLFPRVEWRTNTCFFSLGLPLKENCYWVIFPLRVMICWNCTSHLNPPPAGLGTAGE